MSNYLTNHINTFINTNVWEGCVKIANSLGTFMRYRLINSLYLGKDTQRLPPFFNKLNNKSEVKNTIAFLDIMKDLSAIKRYYPNFLTKNSARMPTIGSKAFLTDSNVNKKMSKWIKKKKHRQLLRKVFLKEELYAFFSF